VRRLPRRRGGLRVAGSAAIIALVAASSFLGSRTTLALLTGTAASTGTFAAGTWATPTTWYLHNEPTPPTGNTTAQFNLALNVTAPTAGTLYNYDTDCDSRAGRSIRRGTGLVSETGTCMSATWRSAALGSGRILTGSGVLRVRARKAAWGTAPTLRAFLRVFDPGTSVYTEISSASVAVTTTSWAAYTPTWALSGVSVPAGRVIEIKIVATGGTVIPEIAYDTTGYPSRLDLP